MCWYFLVLAYQEVLLHGTSEHVHIDIFTCKALLCDKIYTVSVWENHSSVRFAITHTSTSQQTCDTTQYTTQQLCKCYTNTWAYMPQYDSMALQLAAVWTPLHPWGVQQCSRPVEPFPAQSTLWSRTRSPYGHTHQEKKTTKHQLDLIKLSSNSGPVSQG